LAFAFPLARSYSAAAAEKADKKPEKTSYGGLKDEDRIFTNLYGRLLRGIAGICPSKCKCLGTIIGSKLPWTGSFSLFPYEKKLEI
jgi:hypothetical protein